LKHAKGQRAACHHGEKRKLGQLMRQGCRVFRTVDLRQVLYYCALNHAARRYSISRVGLVNPRVGVFFVHPLDWLCREVSGVASTELFAEILDFASQPENSK
jgi:hypothetical protein